MLYLSYSGMYTEFCPFITTISYGIDFENKNLTSYL
jgi:hypothetical protein